MSDLVGNPERISRDAAQMIIKPLNVLLLKMFCYSIVSSHRVVIADYKKARAVNLLTPAQIDTYVIHNTGRLPARKYIKTNPTFMYLAKFLIVDSICHS